VYLDTLSSLHSQVLNARHAEVLTQYHFYLQVLATSAKQPFLQQHVSERVREKTEVNELERKQMFWIWMINAGSQSWLCFATGVATLTTCLLITLAEQSG
jgi:hypothetical protein